MLFIGPVSESVARDPDNEHKACKSFAVSTGFVKDLETRLDSRRAANKRELTELRYCLQAQIMADHSEPDGDTASFNAYPVLKQFVLSDVRIIRRIGVGSYGVVEEVAIDTGTVCAAKRIRDDAVLPGMSLDMAKETAMKEFIAECELMNSLRHPNVVQFYGVCLFPGYRMPALVMERMVTCLHDMLAPEIIKDKDGNDEYPDQRKRNRKSSKPIFPLKRKLSILYNVAEGLHYLHGKKVVHRNMSAKNVLLTAGMIAKIADLAEARAIADKRLETYMTRCSGAYFFLPEAARSKGSSIKYADAWSIDSFSFGVITIFTIGEKYPEELLSPTTYNKKGVLVARTELERRETYMNTVKQKLQAATLEAQRQPPAQDQVEATASNEPQNEAQPTNVDTPKTENPPENDDPHLKGDSQDTTVDASKNRKEPKTRENGISPESIVTLIEECLDNRETKRPTMEKIKEQLKNCGAKKLLDLRELIDLKEDLSSKLRDSEAKREEVEKELSKERDRAGQLDADLEQLRKELKKERDENSMPHPQTGQNNVDIRVTDHPTKKKQSGHGKGLEPSDKPVPMEIDEETGSQVHPISTHQPLSAPAAQESLYTQALQEFSSFSLHNEPPSIHGKPTLPLLMGFPTLKGGDVDIFETIGADYNTLGTVLLNDDEGAKISAIEDELRGSPSSRICQHIIKLWLKGKGKLPVQWCTLVAVLKRMNPNLVSSLKFSDCVMKV